MGTRDGVFDSESRVEPKKNQHGGTEDSGVMDSERFIEGCGSETL